MKKASIITLGCKLNQYETKLMMEQLKDEYEFVDYKSSCELYIINSCAVTSKASKESRNIAKKISKNNPQAKIIYTGCDSYLEKDLPAIIIGNSYKNSIKKALIMQNNDNAEKTKYYSINKIISDYPNKSRAFIKIQEGCNNHCTYCIIPKLRGKERDKDINLVLKEIDQLKNFGEIVLTGTNIGSYNNFKTLLKEIANINIKSRIRISSIEPMYVDNELLDIIAYGNFAKHLHIPLQSGSNDVLKLMGRDYTTDDFESIVNECYKRNIFVGTDVIVGFFKEDKERFMQTYNFIKRLPIIYGHVFSYSKRPHTAAYNIKLKLEKGPVVKERNLMLKNLFKDKFKQQIKNMVGKQTNIVIEPTTIVKNNKIFYKSIASEYFPVLVAYKQDGLIECNIKDFDGEYAYA